MRRAPRARTRPRLGRRWIPVEHGWRTFGASAAHRWQRSARLVVPVVGADRDLAGPAADGDAIAVPPGFADPLLPADGSSTSAAASLPAAAGRETSLACGSAVSDGLDDVATIRIVEDALERFEPRGKRKVASARLDHHGW